MPSPAVVLAWKEARLLRDFVVVVVGCHAGLALLRTLVVSFVAPRANGFELLVAEPMPWVVAGLVGMGAAALSIAGERRNGTWAWQATMPLRWWKALGVKLVAIALAALVAAAGSMVVCGTLGGDAAARTLTADAAWFSSPWRLMLVTSLVLWACLTSLWVPEPLVAAFVAPGCQMAWFVGVSWLLWRTGVSRGLAAGSGNDVAAILLLGPSIGLALAVPWFFRRAWVRPGEVQLGGGAIDIGWLRVAPAAGGDRLLESDGWRSWRRPGPGWALVWHSLKSAQSAPVLGLAAGVGVAATILAAVLPDQGMKDRESVGAACMIGLWFVPVVTGVMAALQTIGSDQASGRVPWPAERGIAPAAVLAAGAAPALAVIGVVIAASALVWIVAPPIPFLGPVLVSAAAATVIGAIHCLTGAIVWRSMLLAFAAGLAGAILSAMTLGCGIDLVNRLVAAAPQPVDYARLEPLVTCCLVALPLLLTGVPAVLVGPWLRDDRAWLPLRWAVALAVVHGLWLAGCAGVVHWAAAA